VQYTLRMRLCPYLLFALLVAVPACNDTDDDIRANVTLLCNHEGALATAAADHLTRYGRRAIPTIEAAMHTATATGKKNLILALRKIGDDDAVPLLGHIARFEPNADVRREAEWTLRQWAGDDKTPARATKSKQAVRTIEEANGVEDAG
jgi:hypothetical protein